ncbi:MAG: hypothetical protein FWF44_06285 [Defluviitaleaceae bacterium]|nr:hypothetical protein [Defluviitaleaceae bacterium]
MTIKIKKKEAKALLLALIAVVNEAVESKKKPIDVEMSDAEMEQIADASVKAADMIYNQFFGKRGGKDGKKHWPEMPCTGCDHGDPGEPGPEGNTGIDWIADENAENAADDEDAATGGTGETGGEAGTPVCDEDSDGNTGTLFTYENPVDASDDESGDAGAVEDTLANDLLNLARGTGDACEGARDTATPADENKSAINENESAVYENAGEPATDATGSGMATDGGAEGTDPNAGKSGGWKGFWNK